MFGTLLAYQPEWNKKKFLRIQALAAAILWGAMVSPALALFDRGGVIGVGARAMGLSGAFTAVDDDASASYWNPAGLVQMDAPEIQGTYGSSLGGLNQNIYFSFHYPFPQDIHTAFSINHSFFPDLPGIQEDQLTLSVAFPVDFVPEKRLMLGGSFRYLYAQEGGNNGTGQGAAADLGMLWLMPFTSQSRLKAALTLTDISTSVHFDANGLDQPVPPLLTAGLAYQMSASTLFSIDIPWMLNNDLILGNQDLGNVRVRGGAEQWIFNGRLGLRAGVISFLTLPAEFSLGAGLRSTDVSFDFAFSSHPQLGDNYRFSIGLVLDKRVSAKPEPRPRIIQSFPGDEEIYLRWEIPTESRADGYMVWIRAEGDKEFRRARREPLQGDSCLLRGSKNGLRYHIYIRSIVQGKEKYLSNELISVSHPMVETAKKYYDKSLSEFGRNRRAEAILAIQKAEDLDPRDFEIKDFRLRLEAQDRKGLVLEENKTIIQQ